MNDFIVFDPFVRQKDCPSRVRYDMMRDFLVQQPNKWVAVAEEKSLGNARLVMNSLRRRGCLSRSRIQPDGSYLVYGCSWRFSDEDT